MEASASGPKKELAGKAEEQMVASQAGALRRRQSSAGRQLHSSPTALGHDDAGLALPGPPCAPVVRAHQCELPSLPVCLRAFTEPPAVTPALNPR
jgi:hypothetical protein